MFPTPDTTMVADGLARLTSRYRNQPNIRALLTVYLTACQELSDVLWGLIVMRWLVYAAGGPAPAAYPGAFAVEQSALVSDQLDTIGRLVGQPRTGLANGLYGMLIYLRIQANRSQGRAEDIIRLAAGLELVGKRLGYVDILPAPGTNAFTNTTAPFVQPAARAQVVALVGDTAWMFVGEVLDVVGGGQYEVFAIGPGGATVTLTNTGDLGNAAPGESIPLGAELTGSVAVTYLELYPAAFLVEILDLSISPFIAASLLHAAKPLGVNGTLHYSDEGETAVGVWGSVHDPTAGHGVWQDTHTADPPGVVPVAHWVATLTI